MWAYRRGIHALPWYFLCDGAEFEKGEKQMFMLNSDRLRVEIAEPGEAPNDKTRFDRAAYISDVVLDGGMHFGASEPRNLIHPTSGGRGFCSELRYDVSRNAGIGEFFPKFGVGLIRKEADEKYIFHKTYQEICPFAVDYRHTDREALFVMDPAPCMGYAMKTVRRVSVEGNKMTLETETENTGEKDLFMEDFCHNFISIDGMAVGSDYELDMPCIPDLGHERLVNRRGFSGVMRGNGRGLTFCEFTAIDTDIAIDCGKIEKIIPFIWKMRHKGAKAFVECKEYFVPAKIAIWGVDHMLCPEITHRFSLKPGERCRWKRVWRFDIYE